MQRQAKSAGYYYRWGVLWLLKWIAAGLVFGVFSCLIFQFKGTAAIIVISADGLGAALCPLSLFAVVGLFTKRFKDKHRATESK